jgi:hypothetical protein
VRLARHTGPACHAYLVFMIEGIIEWILNLPGIKWFTTRLFDRMAKTVFEEERRLVEAGIESITDEQRSLFRLLKKGDIIIIDGDQKK